MINRQYGVLSIFLIVSQTSHAGFGFGNPIGSLVNMFRLNQPASAATTEQNQENFMRAARERQAENSRRVSPQDAAIAQTASTLNTEQTRADFLARSNDFETTNTEAAAARQRREQAAFAGQQAALDGQQAAFAGQQAALDGQQAALDGQQAAFAGQQAAFAALEQGARNEIITYYGLAVRIFESQQPGPITVQATSAPNRDNEYLERAIADANRTTTTTRQPFPAYLRNFLNIRAALANALANQETQYQTELIQIQRWIELAEGADTWQRMNAQMLREGFAHHHTNHNVAWPTVAQVEQQSVTVYRPWRIQNIGTAPGDIFDIQMIRRYLDIVNFLHERIDSK